MTKQTNSYVKDNFISQHKIILIGILLISLVTILQIPAFLSNAYVPDEAWFYWLAEQKANTISFTGFGLIKYIFSQTNELGYGSLYWIAYTLHIKIFTVLGLSKAVIFAIARLESLLLVISTQILLLIYGKIKGHKLSIYILLFWLSFPVVWWYGKLTAPEPLLIFLSLFSLSLIFPPKKSWLNKKISIFGWLILGIGVGIKLNFLPILIFAVTLHLLTSKFNLKEIIVNSGIFLWGFIIANPFIVTNYFIYLENIHSSVSKPILDLEHLIFIFSNSSWTWDIILNGGLFQWSMPFLIFISFLSILITQGNRKIYISFLLAFLTATLIFFLNSRFLGWYWFPLLPVIPFVLLLNTFEKSKTNYLLVLLIGMNISLNFNQITYSYGLKQEHVRNLSKVSIIESCLSEKIVSAKIPYDQIINMSEIRLKLTTSATSTDTLMFYPSYEKLVLTGNNVLFLIGDRVRKIYPYDDIYSKLQNATLKQDNENYVVKEKSKCDFVNFYYLSKES